MDTVVKLALVFIISLLSFSIGTFVGKQFSDQQHKTAMIEKEGGQGRTTASIPTDSLEVEPENALTDADIASITEEFATAEKDDIDELLADKAKKPTEIAGVEVVEETTNTKKANKDESIDQMMAELNGEDPALAKAEATPETKEEATGQPPTELPKKEEVAKTETKSDMVTDTAMKVANQDRPTVKDKKEASRIPTSLPSKIAATSVGKYTVQVAAYQKVEEAETYKKKLVNQGYSAFHVAAKVKGNTWYRVNVGLFADRTKAQVFRKRIMKEANLKSALVKKIVQ